MSGSTIRSALFVPGSRPERFSKALAAGADVVIVDFEDAVEESLKRQARDNLVAFLQTETQASVWVRINAPEHSEHAADIAFCQQQSGVAGVLLPKAESGAQVAAVAVIDKPIWPIIESARGILKLAEIAAGQCVQRLAFGALDYGLDLNLKIDSPSAQFVLDQARVDLLLHSRESKLLAPLDGVYPSIDDFEGLHEAICHAYDMGFAGAMCIHPKQISVIHRAMAPTAEMMAWAQRVVDASTHGRGAFQIDGQMVDAPVLIRAQRILATAPINPNAHR
ncbi:HpcH/HpaI aldolase/citrate lyase family protein [Pseudomonas mucidolens]|uniref:(S)-citramalyl-CoA lyase n=1 Tax=Pseudomonas mucidolens TaxID=46679 RepID=A0A1H2MNR9_9PSED|nr:CoA ester lyase [Pseudomonas mucidolens]SDU94635.1 (S)-citramalyl-CoA lyase [Pseudomonas mucidolens]SQH33545.1 HpcH/HpaI aldolase/citrate lyase family [Pseudomonas mucidolens]